MTSQSGKQTIATRILPYISRSKDNQTLKLGQLVECNMRKTFLEGYRNILKLNFRPLFIFLIKLF